MRDFLLCMIWIQLACINIFLNFRLHELIEAVQ